MEAQQTKILLRGATVLIHNSEKHVTPVVSDLLIVGDTIAKIEKHIEADESTKVLECGGKIVSPGFISTHHHVYQTAMKGKHADHTLIEYMPIGNFSSTLYSLENTFWGQLSGALEVIDGGTTTVIDHSSLNNSPDTSKTSLQALVTSGIRAVYCYSIPWKISSWKPLDLATDFETPWVMETWKSLASKAPFANGRIQLGFAIDNLYAPPDVIRGMYRSLRDGGAKVITTHAMNGVAVGGAPSSLRILADLGLLESDVVLSHAIFSKDGDEELFTKSGAFISSTPNTELQMGQRPVALLPEYEAQASIGVDCHSFGTSYMPAQMRLLLQDTRCRRQDELAKDGKWSRHVGPTVEQVFNLATINGARATGMSSEIGQIKVGMKADLVIYDTSSPSMLAAAQENPVAAIVQHSSERDVETVIVDGVIRKEAGKLVDFKVSPEIDGGKSLGLAGKSLGWKHVVAGVLKSRAELDKKASELELDARTIEDELMKLWYLNTQVITE